MTRPSTTLSLLALIVCLCALFASVAAAGPVEFRIVALDPPVTTELATNDKLYLQVAYSSDIPLRFQAEAALHGTKLEAGVVSDPAALHIPGQDEALLWLSFRNPTHIDEVRVTAFDEEWQPLASLSQAVDMTWHDATIGATRQTAPWVDRLLKAERRKLDYVYDPAPRKKEDVYDFFFMVSVLSIAPYVLLQVQMLRRYRGRWRELALAPLITFLPLLMFTLTGAGIDISVWIVFTFRYIPFALLFLVVLWLVKQVRTPPPPRPKPPRPNVDG